MLIPIKKALQELQSSPSEFKELFAHGSLSVEIYKPNKVDKQQPHERDEIYVIVAGTGTFYLNGKRSPFKTGDFIFVPAFAEHRFEDFTDDFSTWVFFYGPKGGEGNEGMKNE